MTDATAQTLARPVCSFCGKALEGEESEQPRLDPRDNQPTCDDCYTDNFEFDCCGCSEYGNISDQHNFVVAFDGDHGVVPGLYRVTDSPYYTQALLGSGWLRPHALELVATLPIRWPAYKNIIGATVYRQLTQDSGEGYPCGHLCIECQTAIAKECFKQ